MLSEHWLVSGREFKTASTLVKIVYSSSKVALDWPRTFLRLDLTPLMSLSKNLPHRGALARMKLHSILLLLKCS